MNLVALETRDVPATFTVTSFSDSSTVGVDLTTGKIAAFGNTITLRSAILASNATAGTDDIVVPAGSYTLSIAGSNEDAGITGDLDITDSVNITATGAIVDAAGLNDRIIQIFSGVTAKIDGGTYQNGLISPVAGVVAQGGGIFNAGTLTLANAILSGNIAKGAIRAAGGTADGAQGGGIYSAGDITINSNILIGNQAIGGDATGMISSSAFGGFGQGGGLFTAGGTATISLSRITSNFARGGQASAPIFTGATGGNASGGGASLNGASATITGTSIDANQALGGSVSIGNNPTGGNADGGGIALNVGTATITESVVEANILRGGSATGDAMSNLVFGGRAQGAGIQLNAFISTNRFENTTVSGNSGKGGDANGTSQPFAGAAFGGGFSFNGFTSSALIGNTTITDNEVLDGLGTVSISSAGGGLYNVSENPSSQLSVISTIIAGNRTPTSSDVAVTTFPISSLGSNLIGISAANTGFVDGVNGDQVGTALAPLDAKLTPLANFSNGNFQSRAHGLNIGSPARDKGNAGTLTNDQRGVGFFRGIGVSADVGALEVQDPTTTQITFVQPPEGVAFPVVVQVNDVRLQPTGTVQLFLNGISVGSGTLDATGSASFNVAGQTPGVKTISFTYTGDAAYRAASISASITILTATTTNITVTPNPVPPNQLVTFQSKVTSSTGAIPVGTVTFLVNNVPIGTPVTLDTTGTAVLPVLAGFSLGSYSVSSTYSGDSTFDASASSTIVTLIVANATTTTASAAPNPAFPLQPLTLSANLASSSAVPTGSMVSFTINGVNAGTGSTDASGNASLPMPAGLALGTYSVVASFAGSPGFLASSSTPVSLVVNPSPTATTTTFTPANPIANAPITLSANVTATFGTPTGSVDFLIDGSVVGSGVLDASGNATFALSAGLTAGPHNLTANYTGVASFVASRSGTQAIDVLAVPTATALAVSPTSPTANQPFALTAMVTSASGVPTGTVIFTIDGANVGSASLDASGTATVPIAGLPTGTYVLVANYSGTASTFAVSASSPRSLGIAGNSSTTTLVATPNPVFATDPLVLTANVVGSVSGAITGSVTFTVNGANVGAATVDASGNATLTLPAGLNFGSYSLAANYSGDSQFSGSASTSVTLGVSAVPTRTQLVVTPTPTTFGNAVTFTANVAFAPGTSPQRAGVNPAILNGTVNFFNGATMLGSAPIVNGNATLTTSVLPIGVNTVSAVFVPASADLTSSRGTASVQVDPVPKPIREVFAVGSGFWGGQSIVNVYDANGTLIKQFVPFGASYTCGVVVATADVTGDGVEDIIVGTAFGGGPHVKIFDGVTFAMLSQFFAYDPNFRGGITLAAGDLNGDGIAEIATGSGPGGGPQVNVYSYANGGVTTLSSFFAYDPNLRGGASVAISSGLLVTGAGFGGGPQIRVFQGMALTEIASFFAFDSTSRVGVNVAISESGTNSPLAIIASTPAGRGTPLVQSFTANGTPLASSLAFEAGFDGGVTTTSVRLPNGSVRTVFGSGYGGAPRVRVIDSTGAMIADFYAFDENSRGGVFVG